MERAFPSQAKLGTSWMTDDASFFTAHGTINSRPSTQDKGFTGPEAEAQDAQVGHGGSQDGQEASSVKVTPDHDQDPADASVRKAAGEVRDGIPLSTGPEPQDSCSTEAVVGVSASLSSSPTLGAEREASSSSEDATISIRDGDRIRQVFLAFDTLRAGSASDPQVARDGNLARDIPDFTSSGTVRTTITDETPFPSRILHLFPRLSTLSPMKPLPSSMSVNFRQYVGDVGDSMAVSGMTDALRRGTMGSTVVSAWLQGALRAAIWLSGLHAELLDAVRALLAPSAGRLVAMKQDLSQLLGSSVSHLSTVLARRGRPLTWFVSR